MQEKNREHSRYLRNRSTTRSFLRKQATLEDIDKMERLISEQKNSYSILSKSVLLLKMKRCTSFAVRQ